MQAPVWLDALTKRLRRALQQTHADATTPRTTLHINHNSDNIHTTNNNNNNNNSDSSNS